jgi:uncharacterized protein involved in exopolysaccharide biosynthesis
MSDVLDAPSRAHEEFRPVATAPAPELSPGDRTGAAVQAASALVLRAVFTRWYLVAATAVVAVGLALAAALAAPRTYTARTSFTTESRRGGGSQLAGLAAQFGIGGAGDATGSPAFYLDLVQSPVVLGRVVDAVYTVSGGRRARYAQLVGVKGISPADERVAAMRDLSRRFSAALSPKTGVIKMTVTTRSPALSKAIADTLFAALNEFNLRRRQTQAGEERRFVERRLAEARADVREAEERQRAFLATNRIYQTSPELILQHDRLQREVQFRQSLLTTLASSYEAARVDEIRDTPVISVVEPPEVPPLPDPRRPWALFILSGLAGTAVGLALAVWRTRVADGRAARVPAAGEYRPAFG